LLPECRSSLAPCIFMGLEPFFHWVDKPLYFPSQPPHHDCLRTRREAIAFDRAPISSSSFSHSCERFIRLITLHRPCITEASTRPKDSITATRPRPVNRVSRRIALYLTIFSPGATLGETAENRSRRSIEAVYRPDTQMTIVPHPRICHALEEMTY